MCNELKSNLTRCTKPCAAGDTMCKLHRTIATRRAMETRAVELHGFVTRMLFIETAPVTDINVLLGPVETAWHLGNLFERDYVQLIHDIRRNWEIYTNAYVPFAAKPMTELERLAMDTQNVHTQVVAIQTSDGMKFLLETSVPAEQDTMGDIRAAWAPIKGRKRVLRDMEHWYDTAECVQANDFLYKRMLDGLWARIQAHKERDELTKRLWEEASESVGKCCQGHLSRLTNVLVGFMDEVKAEVPVGELLQQKIAAIAAQDIRVEEKVCAAWAVFEELKIPMEQRDAWIEAF